MLNKKEIENLAWKEYLKQLELKMEEIHFLEQNGFSINDPVEVVFNSSEESFFTITMWGVLARYDFKEERYKICQEKGKFLLIKKEEIKSITTPAQSSSPFRNAFIPSDILT